VIVAGTFWNTLDFGAAGLLTADPIHQVTPGWDSPGFLAKINPNTGTAIWATTYGTEISSVATDAYGNVFVAGASGSDIGDVSAWIAKLPPSGDPSAALWEVELQGAVPPIGVGVDLDGNVIVGGSYYEKLYFDGANPPRLEAGKKSWATFLGKLSGGDASPIWMENIAAGQSAPNDRWSALAVGPGPDDIYLTGAAGSWCGTDSCLEKYSRDGAFIWSVPLEFTEPTGTIYGNPRDAAVAEDGTVYVTGRLLAASGEPRDVFLARYSGNSTPAPTGPMWWSHIKDSGFDPGDTLAEATEVVLTEDGAVVAGASPKSPDVGATSFYDGALCDVDDIYTAGFGSDTGDRQWVRHAGGAFQDYVEALAVAPGGRIVIAGRFVGSMLFEGTLLEVPAEIATANPDSWGLFIGSYLGQTDSTPPALSLPGSLTVEAQGPSGAVVSYTANASDLLDGSLVAECTPASGSTFALGDTTVTCSAVDTDGNAATGQFTVTVQDTTAPALALPGPIGAEAAGSAGTQILYTATASDLVDGEITPACAPASGSVFGIGQTMVSCTATDSSGNSASGTFPVAVVDTTPPAITVPDDIVVEATGSSGATVAFEVTVSDAADPTVAVSCDPASGSTFPVGETTVDCSATDVYGNGASASFSVTVEDTIPPVVTVPANLTFEATGPAGATVTFAASANDTVSGDILDVLCSPVSGSTFGIGDTEVTCSAFDAANNEGTASFLVTVEDTTAPVLDLPEDMTVEAQGTFGAMVAFGGAAQDLVDGELAVDCTPSSPSDFALGSHLVTCTATDAAGNTASGEFAVTVQDTTAPTLTLSSDIVIEATGPAGAVVSYDAAATDLADASVALECSSPSGSTFAIGDTTVSCTATDASANATTGSFTITVQDTTPPVVGQPTDLSVEATGPGGVVVTFAAPPAIDVVSGVVAVTCVPASGSTFPLGETVVTCSATDAYGNTGSSSFHVEVTDTTAPVLALPADITAEAEGADGAVVTFAATASDIVDGDVEVLCTRASGEVFALGQTIVTCWAEDAEGNLASDTFVIEVEDTTPPVITVPDGPVIADYAGDSGTPVTYTASAIDLVDGDVAVSCTPASGSLFDPGVTAVTCTAVDAAGNAAEPVTFTVEVHYSWSGFASPLSNDGKVFKQGSNIPVKFVLTGDDASITDLYATLWVAQVVGGEVSGEWAPASSASSVEDNEFRYSPPLGGYIFDLDTDNMAKGTWRLRAELYDGAERTVEIKLN